MQPVPTFPLPTEEAKMREERQSKVIVHWQLAGLRLKVHIFRNSQLAKVVTHMRIVSPANSSVSRGT